jgi:Putative adhesin
MPPFFSTLNVLFFTLCLTNPAPATESFDAARTIRIDQPKGEVNIEGWDQPKIEIGVIGAQAGDVKSERRGDEVVVTTNIPSRERRNAGLTYSIKVPRDSKIVIDRGDGGVYVTGVAGDIEASVHHGQITVNVPENAVYNIDAHTKFGSVYSDLAGDDKRRYLFRHDFSGGADSAAHKLQLRVGYGDIVIMKTYSRPKDGK